MNQIVFYMKKKYDNDNLIVWEYKKIDVEEKRKILLEQIVSGENNNYDLLNVFYYKSQIFPNKYNNNSDVIVMPELCPREYMKSVEEVYRSLIIDCNSMFLQKDESSNEKGLKIANSTHMFGMTLCPHAVSSRLQHIEDSQYLYC